MFLNIQMFGAMNIKRVKVKARIFYFFPRYFQLLQQWQCIYLSLYLLTFSVTPSLALGYVLFPMSLRRQDIQNQRAKAQISFLRHPHRLQSPFISRKLKPRGGSVVCTGSTESEFKLCFSRSFCCILLVLKTEGWAVFEITVAYLRKESELEEKCCKR